MANENKKEYAGDLRYFRANVLEILVTECAIPRSRLIAVYGDWRDDLQPAPVGIAQ